MSQTPPDLTDRDVRQRELVPPARLAEVHAVVVGVGAVGRQAALQLAAMGVPKLSLIDFDTVEVANLACQGWRTADLGRFKAHAAGEACRELNPALSPMTLAQRFRRTDVRDWPAGGTVAVFCCVDDIAVRRLIWESVRPRIDFWADGRMSAEVVRVLASGSPGDDVHYATTLFAPEQAYAGSCTAKSTIYTANIAAGLMLAQFAKWLRGLPVEPDILLNLLAAEMTVVDAARSVR